MQKFADGKAKCMLKNEHKFPSKQLGSRCYAFKMVNGIKDQYGTVDVNLDALIYSGVSVFVPRP